MERIRVTSDELEQLSTDIKAASCTFRRDTEHITDLLSSVTGSWQGETSSSLTDKARSELEDCKHLIGTLETLADKIDNICDIYQTATNELIAKIQSSVKNP